MRKRELREFEVQPAEEVWQSRFSPSETTFLASPIALPIVSAMLPKMLPTVFDTPLNTSETTLAMVFTTFVIVDAMPFQTLVTIPVIPFRMLLMPSCIIEKSPVTMPTIRPRTVWKMPDITSHALNHARHHREYRRYLVGDGREHGSDNRKNRVENAGHDCLYGRPDHFEYLLNDRHHRREQVLDFSPDVHDGGLELAVGVPKVDDDRDDRADRSHDGGDRGERKADRTCNHRKACRQSGKRHDDHPDDGQNRAERGDERERHGNDRLHGRV